VPIPRPIAPVGDPELRDAAVDRVTQLAAVPKAADTACSRSPSVEPGRREHSART
jgi:hypothetical protein